MQKFISTCLRLEVVKTALKLSIIVGTILAAINHGPAILSMAFTKQNTFQILLTYIVPYAVSTYSSVKVILSNG